MDTSDIKELVILAIIAIILALSFSIGLNLILKTDTPQVAVTTRSMTPTYWGFYNGQGEPEQQIGPFTIPVYWLRGDLLIIQGVPYDSLEVGDVIVFDDPAVDIPVVHRIVAINVTNSARFFLTKGDDNPVSDSNELNGGNRFGWIHQDSVHGKVIIRIPNVGWLSLQIQSPEAKLVLIVIAGLLLLLSFWEDGEKESKKDEEKTVTDKDPLESPQEKQLDEMESDDKLARPGERGESAKTDEGKGSDGRFSVYRLTRGDFKQQFFKQAKKFMTVKMIPAWILLLIVVIFSVSASVNFLSGSCEVKVMMRDEDTLISEWQTITYAPHSTLLEKWSAMSSNSSYSVYSYNIKLAITSRGFLNWVSSVEVETNTSSNEQNDNLYRWTVVYDFHGTKTINGCIKMYLLDDQPSTGVQVTVRAKTSGLLNQGTREWQYQIKVDT
ncbi:MAG: signal peptidase I [Candidatus Odinarchaeota archaeon]